MFEIIKMRPNCYILGWFRLVSQKSCLIFTADNIGVETRLTAVTFKHASHLVITASLFWSQITKFNQSRVLFREPREHLVYSPRFLWSFSLVAELNDTNNNSFK